MPTRRKPEPAPPPRPYHHGSLPEALLAAAETVLLRDGIAGLGLRSIAREAGVSHTAPKHHFGDTTGLLSALAAVGFQRLGEAMRDVLVEGADAVARRHAIARAYVHFANDNAALFGLMFRNEKIDMQNPALAKATGDAMRSMAAVIGGKARIPEGLPPTLQDAEALQVTAAWGYVHGLAILLIDQRLRGLLKLTPGFGDPVKLVDAVLAQMRLGLGPKSPSKKAKKKG